MARQKDTADKEEKVAEERPAPSRSYLNAAPARHGWLYGALAIIVLLLVFMFGAAAERHHSSRQMVFGAAGFKTSFIGPGRMHERSFGIGGTQTANGEDRTTGVVTSVNGNNFTVAGNGATTNVTTNSSTQYRGGNQVKQNDTVIVRGTTSNGTITATEIVINP